jgi:hypothetical protein
MYSGGPMEVGAHLDRLGRKCPNGGNSIEHLLDVIKSTTGRISASARSPSSASRG